MSWVPVTIILVSPSAALLAAVKVIVEEHVGLQEFGEKDAETPDGRPEAVRETGSVSPELRVTVIVLVVLDPLRTALLPSALREKENGFSSLTVSVNVVTCVLPLESVPVTVTRVFPKGTLTSEVIVKVVVHPGLHDDFENEELIPF